MMVILAKKSPLTRRQLTFLRAHILKQRKKVQKGEEHGVSFSGILAGQTLFRFGGVAGSAEGNKGRSCTVYLWAIFRCASAAQEYRHIQ